MSEYVYAGELEGNGEDSLRCISNLGGNVVVSGSQDFMVRVYVEGHLSLLCPEATNWITAVIGRADGIFLSGSRDKSIRVYKNMEFVGKLDGHEGSLAE